MRPSLVPLLLFVAACGDWGNGSKWMEEPLVNEEGPGRGSGGTGGAPKRVQARTIGQGGPATDPTKNAGGGRVVGTFRNTYYDFPRESDFSGETAQVLDASCQPIAKVPKAFHDAVCVQGSGSLARGGTISFAKRDCSCADTCPRTGQKICFELLDAASFPFGRGAAGKAITPMKSVAADTTVLPMGTVIYVPELDGEGSDGCFVVEDRGSKVKGQHVDFFTGDPSQTKLLNARVPSNQGVTVVVDAPRCSAPRP